jgi:catechol 2,3-dioxygenase-like lactoylglutathione lyase family enzyme
MATRFECTIPILRVADLQASLRFYETVLGFKRDWGGDDAYKMIASVSRDDCSLMLFEEGQGQPGTWVWIGVEDVAALHAEYEPRGVKVVMAPTNFAWALEMRIEDPDGHVLRIGSEPRSDLPICRLSD